MALCQLCLCDTSAVERGRWQPLRINRKIPQIAELGQVFKELLPNLRLIYWLSLQPHVEIRPWLERS
jgi:hypothetical protein